MAVLLQTQRFRKTLTRNQVRRRRMRAVPGAPGAAEPRAAHALVGCRPEACQVRQAAPRGGV